MTDPSSHASNIASTLDDNSSNNIKNMNLIEYHDIHEKLNKWTIPIVSPSTMYKKGMFSFISCMAVKTVKQTMNISQDNETISLINSRDIIRYRGKYKYMHIGLVQVAFKPLTLLGTNTSIQATLNHSRCLDWQQSIMGVVETSLCLEPVYFNVYHNLTLSLTNRHIG